MVLDFGMALAAMVKFNSDYTQALFW